MQRNDDGTISDSTDGKVFKTYCLDGECFVEIMRHNAAAPRVPEGWKLVPVQMTKQMREAFKGAHEDAMNNDSVLDSPDNEWKALLTAAPAPAEQSDGVEYWREQYKQLAEIGDKALTETRAELAKLRNRVKELEDDKSRLLEHCAAAEIAWRDEDSDQLSESWRALPDHLQDAVNKATEYADLEAARLREGGSDE